MGTSETMTEILVHITAPSRASDDVRYRQLATEYLAFEPTRQVELPKDASLEPPHPQSQDEFISPQASFGSVWDNVNSPSLVARKEDPKSQSSIPQQLQDASQKENEPQASWVAPPSEVPDSMPYNDISVPAFCSPTKVLHYYLQTREPQSESPAGSSSQPTEVSKNVFDGTVPQEAYDTVVFTGESPNRPKRPAKKIPRCVGSYKPAPAEPIQIDVVHGGRTCDTPSSASRLRKEGAKPPIPLLPEAGASLNSIQATPQSRKVIDNTTIIPSTQVRERAESDPPSSKRHKRGPPKEDVPALGRSASDVLPRGSNHGADLQPVTEAKEESSHHVLENPDWSHVTQIISAEPSVGNHSLGPRPPASLERLAEDGEMKRRYRPSYQARKMRPYERGYWLVKLDGWEHQEKVAFWGFLGNYIRRDGNAGWGTRACRDESWSWMRLYGWEHIAGELYILLYVASYRLLKCMELRFHDGAGDVLIVVGARSDRRSLG
ncbi:hypothetical protein SLS53_002812 [Cytospora paraplurivora]|uniref:Uncharacterized protein n=1 Tax=Cytospora paraplurivora TaxID=2898453 RepID=A0AAN9UCA7_9PEZI